MKFNFKKTKGITLIALIVTIIVLIILAGVAIAMLRGDSGTATKATEAKSKNVYTTAKEQVLVVYNGLQTEINTQSASNSSYDATDGDANDSTTNFGKLVNLVKSDLGITTGNSTTDGKWTVDATTKPEITITCKDSSISTSYGAMREGEMVSKITIGKQKIDEINIDLPKAITFEVEGVTYQADYGMTWFEWIDSEYNTTGFKLEYCNFGNINIQEEILPDNKYYTNTCPQCSLSYQEGYRNYYFAPFGISDNFNTDFVIKCSKETIVEGSVYSLTAITQCFAEGTKIMTNLDGETKNIEDLKDGENIVSYDVAKGEKYLTTINKVYKKKATKLSTIKFNNGTTLYVTPNHPLHSVTGEWKSVDPTDNENAEYPSVKLNIGDEIVTNNGTAKVLSINTENFEEAIDVYTLSVESNNGDENNNNFFADGVLAHNY